MNLRIPWWINRWGPVLVMALLIFLASSLPSDKIPNAGRWDFSVKKGGHMLGYALLAISLVRAQGRWDKKSLALAVLGCVLYALSDEFHQSFVRGRSSTLFDVGIDTIGASLGLALRIGLWGLYSKRHS